MLKLVPLQGGPEPQLGLCMAGALPTGTKTGQTVATTQYFAGSLSAVSEKSCIGCDLCDGLAGCRRWDVPLGHGEQQPSPPCAGGCWCCGTCCSTCVSFRQVTSWGLAMGLGLS